MSDNDNAALNRELEQLRAIADRTREMRKAQRSYFTTRDAHWLNQSKQLERQVDVLFQKLDHAPIQRDLFPGK